ncbi:hypothetical protein HF295_06875 [Hujiaoplasma nucleasis]|uniref:Uncharacterized protein n=1 Tax=Hujiaoplasma nucleasis TaxID=2725268 RepID=A0A7L6N7S0_9MOLU|nr:hypothetical protein [Hujiaoplasma nucleasis]QLY40579.1 hypothetical protein HF295_06875 [Hujiaoplasma nucleasis]
MITKEMAEKLWKDVFGNKEWAQDCFGVWMHRDAWSNTAVMLLRPGQTKKYDYSWNVDHIRPKSDFNNPLEADFFNNFEPMQRGNNSEKGDNYPHFSIGDKKYKVFSQSGYYGYGIIDVSTNKKIDWKSKQGKHY